MSDYISELLKRVDDKQPGFLITGQEANSSKFMLSVNSEVNWLEIAESYFAKKLPTQKKATIRIVVSNPDSFEMISAIALRHGFELMATAVIHIYKVVGIDDTQPIPALAI